MKLYSFVFLIFMGVTQLTWAEVLKWVDENGKVHYGDTIPEQYKDQAEVLEEDKVNVVSPEADVKRKNTTHVNKLRAEDAQRLREQKQQAKKAQREWQYKQKQESEKSTLSREECRNKYPNKVKLRTECFLQAEGKDVETKTEE